MNQDLQIFIQARLTSTRLPGKVLLPLAGKAVLDHVVEACQKVGPTTVLIPHTPKNDALLTYLMEKKTPFIRGSEFDVLDRFYQAWIEKGQPEVVVRVTADCPLLPAKIIQDTIDYFTNGSYEYVSNTVHRTYPKGYDVEVFKGKCLERAHLKAQSEYDLEHVTPWMQRNVKVGHYIQSRDESNMNLCIDTQADYDRLKFLLEE